MAAYIPGKPNPIPRCISCGAPLVHSLCGGMCMNILCARGPKA